MTFNLQSVLESKRALRRDLAALPIREKLRMLDSLRARTVTIRGSSIRAEATREQRPKEDRGLRR